jgi:hypothetical protein
MGGSQKLNPKLRQSMHWVMVKRVPTAITRLNKKNESALRRKFALGRRDRDGLRGTIAVEFKYPNDSPKKPKSRDCTQPEAASQSYVGYRTTAAAAGVQSSFEVLRTNLRMTRRPPGHRAEVVRQIGSGARASMFGLPVLRLQPQRQARARSSSDSG